jgi:hypothetical protein
MGCLLMGLCLLDIINMFYLYDLWGEEHQTELHCWSSSQDEVFFPHLGNGQWIGVRTWFSAWALQKDSDSFDEVASTSNVRRIRSFTSPYSNIG